MAKDMSDPVARRRTFDIGWQKDDPKPEDLVAAGLYFIGKEDTVQCYKCNWQMKDWEAGSVPLDEHKKQNPLCPFVRESWKEPVPHWNPERKTMTKDHDQLDYEAHARHLTAMLTDKATSTPLTVGIFANWGQGKTAVMELIEEKITNHQDEKQEKTNNHQDEEKGTASWRTRLFFSVCCKTTLTVRRLVLIHFLFMICLFIIMIVAGYTLLALWHQVETYELTSFLNNHSFDNPMLTTNENNQSNIHGLPNERYATPTWMKIVVTLLPAVFVLLILLSCLLSVQNCKNSTKSDWTVQKALLSFFFYPENIQKFSDSSPIKLIMVKFNAWEYAGCDKIWAGIASNLCETLMNHFGPFRCKIYRLIKEDFDKVKETEEGKNERRDVKIEKTSAADKKSHHPEQQRLLRDSGNKSESKNKVLLPYKVGFLPKHAFYMFVVFLFLLAMSTIVIHIRIGTFRDAKRLFSSFGGIVTAIGGISVVAITGIKVLLQLISYVHVRISNLQTVQLDTDIERGLGAMHSIKREISLLVEMVRFMGWVDQKQYRVIINVDDLDRCEKGKVVKLLEAISILLSQANTPFISLLAIDPRIVIRAIESKMKDDMNFANELSFANGYEYLKKIVHLPFWLPVASDHKIKNLLVSFKMKKHEIGRKVEEIKNVASSVGKNMEQKEIKRQNNQNQKERPDLYNDAITAIEEKSTFLLQNPRSVKRLCNILNLAMRLWYEGEEIDSTEEQRKEKPDKHETVKKLAWLIVLAEQWPYRLSVLIQIGTDLKANPNQCQVRYNGTNLKSPLHDVYKKNIELVSLPREWETYITFDIAEGKFEEVLEHSDVTLDELMRLLRYIVNLDMSLRESICLAVTREDLKKKRRCSVGSQTLATKMEQLLISLIEDLKKKQQFSMESPTMIQEENS